MKAALTASDQHIVKAVSATWIIATLAVMAKKRRRTFGTVVRLSSGRYRARYFYQGVFHNAPETYRSVADANAWLTVEESKILQGTWVPVAGIGHDGSRAGGQMAGLEPAQAGQLSVVPVDGPSMLVFETGLTANPRSPVLAEPLRNAAYGPSGTKRTTTCQRPSSSLRTAIASKRPLAPGTQREARRPGQ